ncbi:MAG: hypothetical protein JST26_06760 [Bacteroidetes bacterium]|nr:hypothetical protein [Bacteroidota bacterium]
MKTTLTLLSLAFSMSLSAQLQHFCSPGEAIQNQEETGLLIKDTPRNLRKLSENAGLYSHIKVVKFSGFNDTNTNLDSALRMLQPNKHIQCLIFEKCDLTGLETSLSGFTALDDIRMLKQTVVDENTFIPLVKDNTIKTLYIQTDDPEISTDSLSLLKNLEALYVSDDGSFTKTNLTQKIKTGEPGDNRFISINYTGGLYQPVKGTGKSFTTTFQNTTAAAKTDTRPYQAPLPCIKQPIPGININDTLYRFNASQGCLVYYNSGSAIRIDQNAFTDQNGKPYNGPVTLFYREFRTPVEIMLSGIPMTNEVNGQTRVFRSGGMYEINAFDKNNQLLKTRSDTSVKINFALSDTASDFQFFSLNANGNWRTVSNTVNIKNSESKAVSAYYNYLEGLKSKADTTSYAARFYSMDYAYTARRDNFIKTCESCHDTLPYYEEPTHRTKSKKSKGLFRVKYLKQTKDGQIAFKIVPAKRGLIVPAHISALFNKTYLYDGDISRAEFRQLFPRKLPCWDLRTNVAGNTLQLNIKTDKAFSQLNAKIITLKDDKTYIVQKRGAKIMNVRISMLARHDGRKFDRKDRKSYGDFNDINMFKLKHKEELAYAYSQKFQTEKEKQIDHKNWADYAAANRAAGFGYGGYGSAVGTALVKSGMGFNNIDCYIHNGQMQDVFVQYNNMPFDSISGEFTYALYKSINTSYNFYASAPDQAFRGYYFKNRANYIIRFTGNNAMQVLSPEQVKENKNQNTIAVNYINEFDVSNMNSNEISKLILK